VKEGVPVPDPVPDGVAVPEPVVVWEGVGVPVDEPDGVPVDDGVSLGVLVPVAAHDKLCQCHERNITETH
jgi:hypothetical protein